ncbi:MAG: 4Fe-4S dicluster domain-containing protein [Clostridiales Family XIII bacterium]|jgi:ferredoxin like protein|nr:4Fe-4S dicluster domain-containing protein [Clostridiales Family XIII bacterium]
MATMRVDDKLGFVRFKVDEQNPHIVLNEDYDDEKEIRLLVMACPAGLYAYEDGKLSFNCEGCLECGTCRVLSLGKAIESWSYPRGGKGVEYRMG